MEYGYSCQRESARDRLKSAVCCCFQHGSSDATTKTPSPRSPRSWLRATAHNLEIKEKCRHLVARIGKGSGGWRHRRSPTSDFGYDPMGYALNFEDEPSRADDDIPILSFSARLTATPERIFTAASDEAQGSRLLACR